MTKDNARIVIIPWAGPAEIVYRHPERFLEVDRIRHVEPVQQESLLTVIVLSVVAIDRIHPAVMPAERLVLLYVNVVAERIRARKVILGACVVDGRINIIIDIHPQQA